MYCFFRYYSLDSPKIMPLHLFERILSEAADFDNRITLISFASFCEPTIDPLFITRLEMLKKYNFKYWNITNGTNLTKEILEYFFHNLDLISHFITINVPSIDIDYGLLTGSNQEQLEKVKRGLDDLGKNIKRYNLSANISVLGLEDENHERNYHKIKNEYEKYGYRISKDMLCDRAGQLKPHINNNCYIENPVTCDCNGVRYYDWIHVGVEGDIYLCCQDFFQKYSIGNVRIKTLNDIWKSEKSIKTINAMKSSLCKNCIYAK